MQSVFFSQADVLTGEVIFFVGQINLFCVKKIPYSVGIYVNNKPLHTCKTGSNTVHKSFVRTHIEIGLREKPLYVSYFLKCVVAS